MKLFRKKTIIYGCEARGDYNKPYLTRYTLIERLNWQICLHVFHRSDAPDLHDHPWNFVSLILWRGYIEVTDVWPGKPHNNAMLYRKRVWPGMVLFRPATHVHRVELVQGAWSVDDVEEKPAVTLVWMGKRIREWGFWDSRGWAHWVQYFKEKGC